MYFKSKSKQAPKGYRIADDKEFEAIPFGIHHQVRNFPHDLPDAIKTSVQNYLGFPLYPPKIRSFIEENTFKRPPHHEATIARLKQLKDFHDAPVIDEVNFPKPRGFVTSEEREPTVTMTTSELAERAGTAGVGPVGVIVYSIYKFFDVGFSATESGFTYIPFVLSTISLAVIYLSANEREEILREYSEIVSTMFTVMSLAPIGLALFMIVFFGLGFLVSLLQSFSIATLLAGLFWLGFGRYHMRAYSTLKAIKTLIRSNRVIIVGSSRSDHSESE
jgi:hypothetical protein